VIDDQGGVSCCPGIERESNRLLTALIDGMYKAIAADKSHPRPALAALLEENRAARRGFGGRSGCYREVEHKRTGEFKGRRAFARRAENLWQTVEIDIADGRRLNTAESHRRLIAAEGSTVRSEFVERAVPADQNDLVSRHPVEIGDQRLRGSHAAFFLPYQSQGIEAQGGDQAVVARGHDQSIGCNGNSGNG